jgi:hypothetical protein
MSYLVLPSQDHQFGNIEHGDLCKHLHHPARFNWFSLPKAQCLSALSKAFQHTNRFNRFRWIHGRLSKFLQASRLGRLHPVHSLYLKRQNDFGLMRSSLILKDPSENYWDLGYRYPACGVANLALYHLHSAARMAHTFDNIPLLLSLVGGHSALPLRTLLLSVSYGPYIGIMTTLQAIWG